MLEVGVGGKKATQPSPRDQEVIRLLESGATYQAVGEQFGITRERVRQIRVRWGLPARRESKWQTVQ